MIGRSFSVCSFLTASGQRQKSVTHLHTLWKKRHTTQFVLKAKFSTNEPIHITQPPVVNSQSTDPDDEDDYKIDQFNDEEIKSIGAALRDGILQPKTRNHVNPLAQQYQLPLKLPSNWLQQNFAQPNNPIHIDIGCARGTWVLRMGQINPNLNILGLEIRKPIVDLCLIRKKVWKLKNVHFLSANANVHLETIISLLEENNTPLESISIQFPDPHFKKRNHKRRVVNADFVLTLAYFLKPGVNVFIQSDILDVFEDMILHFKSSKYFDGAPSYDSEDFQRNISPFPVKTAREILTEKRQLPVYRMLFTRNKTEFVDQK